MFCFTTHICSTCKHSWLYLWEIYLEYNHFMTSVTIIIISHLDYHNKTNCSWCSTLSYLQSIFHRGFRVISYNLSYIMSLLFPEQEIIFSEKYARVLAVSYKALCQWPMCLFSSPPSSPTCLTPCSTTSHFAAVTWVSLIFLKHDSPTYVWNILSFFVTKFFA